MSYPADGLGNEQAATDNGHMPPRAADYPEILTRLQAEFAGLLETTDPETPVTTCAPWRVADLALHLGGVHIWAAAMMLGVDLAMDDPVRPRSRPVIDRFYRGAAGMLTESIATIDPAAPALTLVGPGPAGFWHRRQVHETLIHLWDLANCSGAPIHAVTATMWADCADEVLTVMAPRQVRLGRMPDAFGALRLSAIDTGDNWTWSARPDQVPEAEISGTAESLALLLWRRLPIDSSGISVAGDEEAARRFAALPLTP
ncbi:maleylpyruvate isomerase family mycothiol-dependent enzyme [Rarobacter faecitabidus]|uniref:Uncharacterized protein (TIGR03083 family) n=1 Tax=Rarobacter faecitabidus TaxID=13243 RepID=A0A542ZUW7_RARFA|nr:maleylpyruvate isomerase family mycothiol-dependent enzyme [Rarobacter faecitabidus]TQL64165.1 uncharacterized protein (TIGR03083 family) [Rarobacter faecitabidus]